MSYNRDVLFGKFISEVEHGESAKFPTVTSDELTKYSVFELSNSEVDFSDQNIINSNNCSDEYPLVEQFNMSEEDKDNVKKLLDSWNMGFLFQTCIGKLKI